MYIPAAAKKNIADVTFKSKTKTMFVSLFLLRQPECIDFSRVCFVSTYKKASTV